jgi:hypothetical protein
MMGVRRTVGAAVWLLALGVPASWAGGAPPVEVGESIYLRGVLGSGAPLEAVRGVGGLRTKGTDAACVNCHQRSGLGSVEAQRRTVIPPIAGLYLFHPRALTTEQRDLPYVEGVRANREPYTEATLARAIREGIDSEGRPLGYLMPRFVLDDADMAALIGYLKTLDPLRMPGVTDTALHFATIITPDADPVKRRGMLDVMDHYFAERNSRQMVPSRRLRASGKTMDMLPMFMVHRRWELYVWELIGPASTWQQQLSQHLAKEPVLAVISGLGGSNWAPVHEFCEKNKVPCLFPNVEVPASGDGDFYSLYFSEGVLLEADLIAQRIPEPGQGERAVKAVAQIYRTGDSGERAAQVLASELKRHGVAVRNQVLAPGSPGQGVQAAVRKASSADALVLWLRPDDIAALGEAPAGPATVYMSGEMGGLERSPLPANWRGRTHLAYPFDLPQKRVARVDYPLGWFRIRKIPVVAEQVQTDTYLACGLLSEVLSHMVDTFVRPYLIEQLQVMMEHRAVTGYYPRLTLAPHQPFASKGGYIVHFAEASGSKLIADSDWLVP